MNNLVENTNNKQLSNNKNRLLGLDAARLIAMLMMVQGHTLHCLLERGTIMSGEWYWTLWTFIRGLTAPVFLMVSGAVHIFANKRDENGIFPNATAKKRIQTCLILFFIGYLLQFPVNNLYDLPFVSERGWYDFFKVNVLQMFAATLIFLTLLFKITKNNKQLGITAFVLGNIILFTSHFVLSVDWFEILPTPFAAYFSMQHKTIFPLFPFSAYLLIGSFIGYLAQQKKPEERNHFLIKNLLLFGLFYVVVGYIVNYWYAGWGGYKIIGPSKITPGLIIVRTGLAMWAISLAVFCSKYFERFAFADIISKFSQKALFIYVIHLFIIYGSPITPGLRNFFFNVDIYTAFYCAFFVIFFSLFLVYVYDITSKYEKVNQFYKYLIVAFLIYRLLI